MALAAELRLPLVLVIDTAGPALSAEAEQGGLAGQIAQCLAELVTLDYPDGLGPAGPGQRRAGPGDGARRPGARRVARLAGAATAGGRQRDRFPRHRPRRPNSLRPRASGRQTCWPPGSSTPSSQNIPTPPTSRSSSPSDSPAPSQRRYTRCAE